MKAFNFEGLMAPVFTPFTDDGKFELNLSIIPEYMRRIHSSGITAILVNGTSGEGASQSVREREQVAEAWLEARNKFAPKSTLVVQVGGAPLPDVIHLAAHAEKLGVDGIMCLPDLFYRPGDVKTLAQYLGLISKAAPNTPLLYYHLPGFTGVNLSMSDLMIACEEAKVSTFCGLKFTSSDLQELARCVEVCRSRSHLSVFLGCDDLMVPAFAVGSKSSIATTFNIIPELGLQMDKLMTSQGCNLAEATQLQRKISAIVQAITRGGPWVPTMKAAMTSVTKLPLGPPRPPQQPVSQQHLQDMNNDINKILSKK